MKKIKTLLTAVVLLLATTAFAYSGNPKDGDNVSAKVKAAFQQDFSHASSVSWKENSDFYFASFQLSGVSIDAAYNADGELVGTSRKIDLDQVPLAVSLELAKKYSGYSIYSQVTELNFEGQTSYYIDAQDNTQSLSLKCSGNGDISVDRRIKKQVVKS